MIGNSHRDNVTAPAGRPNLRSRLHFSHSLGRGETTKSERTCGDIGGVEKKSYDWVKYDNSETVLYLIFITLTRLCGARGSTAG